MAGGLQKEIRQTRPFRSLQEEAFLNVLRTGALLQQGEADVFRKAAISPAQYNVLRILRGAGREGLSCNAIGERMIARDPDVTRLLDRLEKRGLVVRAREERDRRVVTVRITAAGGALLTGLDAPVGRMPVRRLAHMGPRKLRRLIDLLEEARATPESG